MKLPFLERGVVPKPAAPSFLKRMSNMWSSFTSGRMFSGTCCESDKKLRARGGNPLTPGLAFPGYTLRHGIPGYTEAREQPEEVSRPRAGSRVDALPRMQAKLGQPSDEQHLLGGGYQNVYGLSAQGRERDHAEAKHDDAKAGAEQIKSGPIAIATEIEIPPSFRAFLSDSSAQSKSSTMQAEDMSSVLYSASVIEEPTPDPYRFVAWAFVNRKRIAIQMAEKELGQETEPYHQHGGITRESPLAGQLREDRAAEDKGQGGRRSVSSTDVVNLELESEIIENLSAALVGANTNRDFKRTANHFANVFTGQVAWTDDCGAGILASFSKAKATVDEYPRAREVDDDHVVVGDVVAIVDDDYAGFVDYWLRTQSDAEGNYEPLKRLQVYSTKEGILGMLANALENQQHAIVADLYAIMLARSLLNQDVIMDIFVPVPHFGRNVAAKASREQIARNLRSPSLITGANGLAAPKIEHPLGFEKTRSSLFSICWAQYGESDARRAAFHLLFDSLYLWSESNEREVVEGKFGEEWTQWFRSKKSGESAKTQRRRLEAMTIKRYRCQAMPSSKSSRRKSSGSGRRASFASSTASPLRQRRVDALHAVGGQGGSGASVNALLPGSNGDV